jgi:hypothetical protein
LKHKSASIAKKKRAATRRDRIRYSLADHVLAEEARLFWALASEPQRAGMAIAKEKGQP